MHKKYYFIFIILLACSLLYFNQHFKFLEINNSTTNSNSSIYTDKLSACTLKIMFDDGNTVTENINDGTEQIFVRVRNATPGTIHGGELFYAEGKPECYISSSSGESLGHLNLTISLSAFGNTSEEDIEKSFRKIIIEKIKNTLLL